MTEEQQKAINGKHREYEKKRKSEMTEEQQKIINDKKREYEKRENQR